MRPDDTEPDDAATLRRQAEEVVRAQPALSNGSLSHDEALALVHELQVHQIELELQNEELVRTRREAEALRDRYADLYDFAPVGYFTLDAAGAIREANLAGAVQLGVERGSLVGAGFATFLDPDSRPGFAAFRAGVLAGGATETCDVSFAARPGRGPWHAQLQGRAAAAGAAGFLRLVVTDITVRRRAEAALRESEAKYRGLFDSLEDGFCIIEVLFDEAGTPVDYVFLEANPAFVKQTGLVDAIGKRMRELNPAHEEHWFEIYGAIAKTGEPRRFVESAIPLIGGWYEVYAFPSGAPGSNRVAVLFTDITERMRREEVLQETRDYLDSLINYANAPIIVWDPGFRITRFNAAFEHLSGYAADEVIGRDLAILFPEESRAESLEKIQRTITERWQSVEIPILRPDGEVRIALWNSANIYDRSGTTLLATIAQGQDITDRTQAEEALRGYAENLQRSNEDLERFAYVASHDLQEPLRSIVSFSQLLERRYRGQLGTDADEYIEFIVEGGTRMQGLILDLLAFSRVNTTRQQIARTDAEDVLAGVVRTLDASLREAGATLTHDPLPVVMADPLQLEQVLANLVSNAVKFRRPDVPLRIHVGARRLDGFWEFSVKDNGIGIAPEYYDKIFVIFQRLHTKESYPGTGIGLAIVKRIVDRHGGQIRVESTPGEGSTFFFTLPAA